MDKRTLPENLKIIERELWKHGQMSLNNGTIKQAISTDSKDSNNAWILYTNNTKVLEELISKVEKNINIKIEVFRKSQNKVYIFPATTQKEKYTVIELKAAIQGEAVLILQKQVLLEKQKWLETLKDLRDAKNNLEVA